MSDHTIKLTTRDERTLSFTCKENEDIIAAAERADIYLNAQCRSGACGACIAQRIEGSCELDDCSDDVLSPADISQGRVLLCRARPRSEMKLAVPYDHDKIRFERIAPRQAKITTITYHTADTLRLELQLAPDGDGTLSLDFEPGQFVLLSIPGTSITRAYSPANTPNWDGTLEFLIKLRPQGRFSTWLRETAAPGLSITVEGPLGTFVLQDNGLRPRYFIAGGCGIAPILSMLRRMAEWREPHPAKLFFGVWKEEDLFYAAELEAMAAEHPNLDYAVCVAQPGKGWPGVHGSPVDALAEAMRDEVNVPDIYICGSQGLIDAVVRVATDFAIPRERLICERYHENARTI